MNSKKQENAQKEATVLTSPQHYSVSVFKVHNQLVVLTEPGAIRLPFPPCVFVPLRTVYTISNTSIPAFVSQLFLPIVSDPNFKPRPTVSEGTVVLWNGAPSLIFASKCKDNLTY